jgi:hypothetical protein
MQEGRCMMGRDHILFCIFAINFNKTRTSRIARTCLEKSINESTFNACSNSLFRLFHSTQPEKRIETSDQACQKYWYKFDNLVKKTKVDFDDILARILADHDEVNIDCVDPIFERIVLNSVFRTGRQKCSNWDDKSCSRSSNHKNLSVSPICQCWITHSFVKNMHCITRTCLVSKAKDKYPFKVLSEGQ